MYLLLLGRIKRGNKNVNQIQHEKLEQNPADLIFSKACVHRAMIVKLYENVSHEGGGNTDDGKMIIS